MPELPEVETVARALRPLLVERTIVTMTCFSARLREPLPVRALQSRLPGRRIKSVQRLGKNLLVQVEGGACLLFHLGMTGSFVSHQGPVDRLPHEHFRITLDDGMRVGYTDARKFGKIGLFDHLADALASPDLAGLGPDALSGGFSATYLARGLRQKTAPIKHCLLDQTLVAGVGNIYASEALFQAGIHPLIPAGALSSSACRVLVREVKKVLRGAIRCGSTCAAALPGLGDLQVYFPLELGVYGRAGEPCTRCGSGTILQIRSGGRSSYLCPVCQPAPAGAGPEKTAGKKRAKELS